MKSVAKIFISIIFLSFNQGVWSTSVLPKGTKTDSVWFKPTLAEDNNQVCGKILMDAHEYFFSGELLREHYFSNNSDYQPKVAGMKPMIDVPAVVKVNNKKVYIYSATHPGCGGACETYQFAASNRQLDESELNSLLESAPPASSQIKLYSDIDGALWLYILDEPDDVLVYKLLGNGSWIKSCKIRFRPEDLGKVTDPDIKRAYEVLDDLKSAVGALTRDAGSCGSMNTHYRWSVRFTNTLPEVLYRPWALKEDTTSPYHDEYGAYERDIDGLKEWSLTGSSEYEAYKNYRRILNETINEISLIYQHKYGWNKKQAEKIARTAITSVVSSTIRFYEYVPHWSDTERELRKAILNKRPIGEIKAIAEDLALVSKDGNESILSLSTVHPTALKYLLDKGLNVNQENAFGKTPLMYAVQGNMLESTRLLLAAGADPNARTTRAYDNCNYTLSTFGMTPLHYAVRYASPEIIKLLLENGAVRFIKSTNEGEEPYKSGTPFDWLKRYTKIDVEDRNLNIPDERLTEIESWLQPDHMDGPSSANGYVLLAEQLYQHNNTTKAFQALGLALELDPDNERALSDMSLVALKSGKFGQSIAAGNKLVKNSKSRKLKANAWFNQGLICEISLGEMHHGLLAYNGHRYCDYGFMYPFYKALKEDDTSARRRKILDTFDIPGNYCDIPARGIKINFQAGRDPESGIYRQLQTLFVLHSKSEVISSQDLEWTVRSYNAAGDSSKKQIVPNKIETINLGDQSLTVFSTGEALVNFPYSVFNYQCVDNKSTAIRSIR